MKGMKEIKSSTKTLIEALRLIANGGIDDPEGVTTAAILEAADRLEELGEGWVYTPDRQEAMTLERFDKLAEEGSDDIDKFMDWKNTEKGKHLS